MDHTCQLTVVLAVLSPPVSPKLASVWKQVTSYGSKVRAVKVSIINESLEDDGIFDIQGSFEQDFGIVSENLAEKQPAYFLVRLDSTRVGSSEWLFLCFVPDIAPIRQKMIYAATRASLSKDLGDSHFTDSIYGTHMNDFTLDGYKRHRASLAAPKPLSERERQLAEIHASEKLLVESMKGGSYRKAHAPGMNFPLTDRAIAALQKLAVTKAPTPAKPRFGAAVASSSSKAVLSPASTPLPASPVISRQNTEQEVKKTDSEANVADDEWDDDNDDAKDKKAKEEEETAAPAEEEEKSPAEPEPQAEPEPEPAVEEAPVERTINFVKLAIDAENERIDLASETKITAKDVYKNIDEDSPRFTFFAFEHTHNGTPQDSLVFMYTCPTKSKIRERMLYSSCRAGVLQAAKDEANLDVAKKLETTDVSDLTEA
ncbi:Twinfilin-1, partial [Lunasporangiospora selenospora]